MSDTTPTGPGGGGAMASKCRYCDNKADRTLVWLKNKLGMPARIRLPWCGCNLTEALKRFWPSPYPVQEGRDYVVESMQSTTSEDGGGGKTLGEALRAEAFEYRRGLDSPTADRFDFYAGLADAQDRRLLALVDALREVEPGNLSAAMAVFHFRTIADRIEAAMRGEEDGQQP